VSFSSEWQLRLCSFSTFNLKTSRFFISHSPRFFNPLLSVRVCDTGNTLPCLIYIVKFLFVKCTLALYVSSIFASLKLLLAYLNYSLIEKDRMGDWSPVREGLLFVTDNTCGSHLQSQVIAWLCRQTVVWVVNNLWPSSQGSYRSHFVRSRISIVRSLDK